MQRGFGTSASTNVAAQAQTMSDIADSQKTPVVSQDGTLAGFNPGGFVPHSYGPRIDPQQDFITNLATVDRSIKKLTNDLGGNAYVDFFSKGPGMQAWNPVLYVEQVKRLGRHLGVTGLALFAAEQLGLFLMNRHGKIWNPLTAIPLPIIQSFIPAALDVLTGTPRIMTGYDDTNPAWYDQGFYRKNHSGLTNTAGFGPSQGDDLQYDLAKGQYTDFQITYNPPFFQAIVGGGRAATGPSGLFGGVLGDPSLRQSFVDDPDNMSLAGKTLVDAALDTRNKYRPKLDGLGSIERSAKDKLIPAVDDLIKGDLHTPDDPGVGHLQTVSIGGIDVNRYTLKKDASSYGTAGAAFMKHGTGLNRSEVRPDTNEISVATSDFSVRNKQLIESAFVDGIIPAKLKGENDYGFVATRDANSPANIISDDVAYLPLSFTDLRPIQDSYRTVYFRPFIKSLNETFSPQWNKANYLGRTDAVATYEATGRSISLTFEVAAFSPSDLKTIWQKLNWLASMVYPEYNDDLSFKSGPIVRMRVGDVINGLGPEGCRGLPGIIDSLEFDYSESLWELEKDNKVPRNIGITLSFTVLHDRPIGRDQSGYFGAIGTVLNGVYTPPGGKKQLDRKQTFVDVTDASDSFRSFNTEMNKYRDFRELAVPIDAPVEAEQRAGGESDYGG